MQQVDDDKVRVLLITSNIGSMFGTDDDEKLQHYWITETEQVKSTAANFVAIHFQESGGKNYKQNSAKIFPFIDALSKCLPEYSLRQFLDIDFEKPEEYTALGAIFFVHQSILSVTKQFNFCTRKFVKLQKSEKCVFSKDLFDCPFIRKERFSRDLGPTLRFGRKGYLQTRWKIHNRAIDLVNLHLFHDDSNLVSMENSTEYSSMRKLAMDYVLTRIKQSKPGADAQIYLFGDFNFRLNVASFVKRITKDAIPQKIVNGIPTPTEEDKNFLSVKQGDTSGCSGESSSECDLNASNLSTDSCIGTTDHRQTCVEYYSSDDPINCILRMGKKSFDFHQPEKLMTDWVLYRIDDVEPSNFPLCEFPILFPPTYPWSEDVTNHHCFMSTRPPAWCDRILMNETAWNELNSAGYVAAYKSYAVNDCTGDHKPVLLAFELSKT